jgi:SAM-dependent methyltransferase
VIDPAAALDEPLPSLERVSDDATLKACCAAVYEHPAVSWLLGGELHPGGEETTLRALGLAGAGAGDALLDIACGQGSSALLAARELGCRAIGVDYGAGAVAAANATAREAGLDDLASFRQGDAEALSFADESFDVVLCECSLCTFPDKPRAIGEARRVLRPGGRLVLADVTVEPGGLPSGAEGPLATVACVGSALSQAGYERLLTDAGMSVLAVEPCTEAAAELAARVHDRLRGARVLGFDRIAGAPMSTGEAIDVLAGAREAIAAGGLGYTIIVAGG